jgi:CRISPR-associated protein Csb2
MEQHREPLARLAQEVTYLGHSHSLVRVGLINDDEPSPTWGQDWIAATGSTLRVPYRGRLKELMGQFERSQKSVRAVRPNPSLVTRTFTRPLEPPPPETIFDPDTVITFADQGGFVPALEAFPLAAKRLRDALLKVAADRGIAVPALLSGHDPDGTPTETPHLAIVPLGDVGWSHSQGRLMGLALIWPRSTADSERKDVLRILSNFVRGGEGECGILNFGRCGTWSIALAADPDRASLRFGRYARPARRWGTVLPLVLDRHPKDRAGEDIVSIVARACVNVGLPQEMIEGLDVEVYKYAPIKGAPSSRTVASTLPADSPYRNRPLVHLVLTFPRPVRGPLILGAGRYRGLGLCLPLEGEAS